MSFDLQGFDLPAFVAATLAEDLGGPLGMGGRDVTSESVIPADARFTGVMDSRDPVTVCGLPIAQAFSARSTPAWRSKFSPVRGRRFPQAPTLCACRAMRARC